MAREIAPNDSKIILYASDDGGIKIDVRFQGETVWLSQQLMAELFQTTIPNINMHISNIFKEGELKEDSVIKDFLITASDGKKYRTKYYNLDMIISVGYRITSRVATHFRRWATRHLREFIVKGFVLDDERLKGTRHTGSDYFDELLERIRDIRASERRFYQKITDIYAQCSVDYDPDSDITKEFYATVQNKMHWAIHGHTASELIAKRVDAKKPHMGLTTWKNAPEGRIRRADVAIAKNYLGEKELRSLNRIVTMYLDYAETQAERKKAMTMRDWVKKLDAFLRFNEQDVLAGPGKVSAEVAGKLAGQEFVKYEDKIRKIESTEPVSDFDKLVKEAKLIEKKASRKKKKS